ncbi:MAG: WbqC family protein [Roseivirga sp.]
MSIAAVMQPTYLPWIGYFDLIDQVDVFVFYDDVQVVKGTWGMRNRIKNSGGQQFLTVPLQKTKSKFETTFVDAQLNAVINWRRKHLSAIRTNYTKAPYFNELFPQLESWLNEDFQNLAELNIGLITHFSNYIGLDTVLRRSSEMDGLEGVKDERLVPLLRQIGCKEYLSPIGAMEYINRNKKGGVFADYDISLFYHQFEHPEYQQLFGDFVSHMAIIDVLFNVGPEGTLKLIRAGRRPRVFFEDAE